MRIIVDRESCVSGMILRCAHVRVEITDVFVQAGKPVSGILIKDSCEALGIMRDSAIMSIWRCREQLGNIIATTEIRIGVGAAFHRQVSSQVAAVVSESSLCSEAPSIVIGAPGNRIATG